MIQMSSLSSTPEQALLRNNFEHHVPDGCRHAVGYCDVEQHLHCRVCAPLQKRRAKRSRRDNRILPRALTSDHHDVTGDNHMAVAHSSETGRRKRVICPLTDALVGELLPSVALTAFLVPQVSTSGMGAASPKPWGKPKRPEITGGPRMASNERI